MIVVIDTNVFISAAGCRAGSSWQCWVLFARRRFRLAATSEILAEYETVADRLACSPGIYRAMNWRPLYQWLSLKANHFEPAPLGKQRSRDAEDDIFLACALASGAKIIISRDNDLLDLEKPFGIEILTPAIFGARFR
jgi:putative PIN family toxin of toxin-antitoxin system